MSNFKALSISVAMLLGAGALAFGQASASPLSGTLSSLPQGSSNIELVDHGWWMHRRHRDFDDGFRFGLTVPLYADDYDDDIVDDDLGIAHVEWCMSRYRSYHPPSDTFLGYDGLRHRCNSPF